MTEAKNQTESDNEDSSSEAYDLLKSNPVKYFGSHSTSTVYVPEGQGLYVSRLALRKLITDGVADRVRVCSIVAGATACEADDGDSLTLGDLHTDLTQATPYGKSHYVKLMVLDKYGVAVNVDGRKVVFYASLTGFVEFCQHLAGKIASESETMQDLRDQITHLKATLDLVDDDRNRTRSERNSSLLTNKELTAANVKLRDENIRLRGLLSDTQDKLKECKAENTHLKSMQETYQETIAGCNEELEKLHKRLGTKHTDMHVLVRVDKPTPDQQPEKESLPDLVKADFGDDEAPVDKDLLRAALIFAGRMDSLMLKAVREEPHKPVQNCPTPPKAFTDPANWDVDKATKDDLRELLRFIFNLRDFLSSNGFSVEIPHIPEKIAQAICGSDSTGKAALGMNPQLWEDALDTARKLHNILECGLRDRTWDVVPGSAMDLERKLRGESSNLVNNSEWAGQVMGYISRVQSFLRVNGYKGEIPECTAGLKNALACADRLKNTANAASKDNAPRVLLERAISLAAAFKRTMDAAKSCQPWYDNKRKAAGLKREPVPSKDLEQAFRHPEHAGLDVMSDIECYILRARTFLAVMEYPGSLPNVHHSLRHILGKAFTTKDGLHVPELLVLGSKQTAKEPDNTQANNLLGALLIMLLLRKKPKKKKKK